MIFKRELLVVIIVLLAGQLLGLDNIYFNASRASNYLSIPSYVSGNDEVVHPDVVYVPEGWNGYSYWMAYTPFPDSAPEYENPSIVVSNDGINWSVPAGLTNPVVEPFDSGFDPNNYYHSDSDLILSPDGLTMYLCWRNHYGWNAEYFSVMTSTDGINWTEPVYPFFTLSTDGERILSPALIYNGSEYELYTVNSKSSPRTYYRRTATSPTGTWSAPVEVEFLLNDGIDWIDPDTYVGNIADAYQIWHLDILFENNEYWCIASVGGASQTRGGQLWIAKSVDGINWVYDNNPLLDYQESGWDKYIYRSCAIPDYDGETMNLKIWYSSDGGTGADNLEWHIGYTEAQVPGSETLSVQYSSMSAVINSWSDTAEIKWQTASEYNMNHYNIYSSENDNSLTMIKRNGAPIAALNLPTCYSFTDESVHDDSLYYWIESVSLDGECEYSPPLLAKRNDSESSDEQVDSNPGIYNNINVYPNPFNPSTTVSFMLENEEMVALELFDVKGSLVFNTPESKFRAGRNSFEISLSGKNIASGIYFCKLKKHSGNLLKKIALLK